MHRGRIKLVDMWLYMSLGIGVATEVLGFGWLMWECGLFYWKYCHWVYTLLGRS